jgi:hypothetical protein
MNSSSGTVRREKSVLQPPGSNSAAGGALCPPPAPQPARSSIEASTARAVDLIPNLDPVRDETILLGRTQLAACVAD